MSKALIVGVKQMGYDENISQSAASNAISISITSSTPQLADTTTGTANTKEPRSPTRFQNFKSNVMKRNRRGDADADTCQASDNSSNGNGRPSGGGGGGGGRIGFSRRYIASKLERRREKIVKAKECHYLHKQIIKVSKYVMLCSFLWW